MAKRKPKASPPKTGASGFIPIADIFGPGAKAQVNKWGAKVTYVDGIRFPSLLEATRYRELLLLQAYGHIACLVRQQPYKLRVNGLPICTYISDFEYIDTKTGDYIVEDAKGKPTREYVIKKKLMRAIYGIDIQEYKAKGKQRGKSSKAGRRRG